VAVLRPFMTFGVDIGNVKSKLAPLENAEDGGTQSPAMGGCVGVEVRSGKEGLKFRVTSGERHNPTFRGSRRG
jgi:hypothetical protein